MDDPLTPRQREIFDWLCLQGQAGVKRQEVAKHFGIALATAGHHLRAMRTLEMAHYTAADTDPTGRWVAGAEPLGGGPGPAYWAAGPCASVWDYARRTK